MRGGGNASSYSSDLSEIGEVAYSDPDMLNPPQMPQEDADTYRAKAGQVLPPNNWTELCASVS